LFNIQCVLIHNSETLYLIRLHCVHFIRNKTRYCR